MTHNLDIQNTKNGWLVACLLGVYLFIYCLPEIINVTINEAGQSTMCKNEAGQ